MFTVADSITLTSLMNLSGFGITILLFETTVRENALIFLHSTKNFTEIDLVYLLD